MSGKDPFEDLLDLGEDSAPPLPSTQPPQSDRWMVLGDGEEDFKSVSEDDLFGSGTRAVDSRSSSKAHGSTFDDLFGDGFSDKKAKKSTGHGTTFDDLFGEEKSSKSSRKGNTFEDLFPEESHPKESAASSSVSSTVTKSADTKVSDSSKSHDEDLFGSLSSHGNSREKGDIFNSKNNEDELDDLFGSKKTVESDAAKKEKDSDEEKLITTSSAGVAAPEEKLNRTKEDDIDALFGTPAPSKSPGVSGVVQEPDLVRDTDKSDKKRSPAHSFQDLDTDKSDKKRSPAHSFKDLDTDKNDKKSTTHTFQDLFGEEVGDKQDVNDLFGVPSQKQGRGSSKKPEKTLDDLFGDSSMMASSSKSDIDDMFGGNSSNIKSTPAKSVDTNESSVASRTEVTKSGMASSFTADLDDQSPGREQTADTLTDVVDGKVDILVSSDTSKRLSSGSQGEGEDLDFSVIQDTSLLDPNITRHKSSLRKRGSLARRKKPTRSSMRRVIQQGDDAFTYRTPDKHKDNEEDEDEDEEEKKTEGGDEVDNSSRKEEVEEEEQSVPPPQKKSSPVVGGKLLIGPDVLGQSQLMKGLAGLKSRPSSRSKPDMDTNSTAASQPETSKSQDSHKPVITPTKPQLSPRPKSSRLSDLKASSSAQKKSVSMAPKPDVVMSTLQGDNKQERSSAFSPALKPTVGVSDSPSKATSMTLEKVALRSTRSSSSPPEPKVSTEESNVLLSERKNSLRKVSPAKNKESDEPKEEKKSQPTWLNEMKLRSTPRKIPDPSTSKSDTSSRSDGDSVKVTLRPALQPRARDVDSPRVSENKPLTPRKPPVDRPKPKIEGTKPMLSVSGKGDAPSRSPLGVKETNTSTPSTEGPSWRRELAERKKKRKEDPMTMSTPAKIEPSPDVAVNWRSQMSQKKRRSITSPSGEVKTGPDNKQPEWAMQAEQRRARLAKSGLIGQK